MTTEKETRNVKEEALKTEACRLRSKADHNIIFEYNGKTCVLAPNQEVPIPDKSKLGVIDHVKMVIL
jgi:hypothetical protein